MAFLAFYIYMLIFFYEKKELILKHGITNMVIIYLLNIKFYIVYVYLILHSGCLKPVKKSSLMNKTKLYMVYYHYYNVVYMLKMLPYSFTIFFRFEFSKFSKLLNVRFCFPNKDSWKN